MNKEQQYALVESIVREILNEEKFLIEQQAEDTSGGDAPPAPSTSNDLPDTGADLDAGDVDLDSALDDLGDSGDDIDFGDAEPDTGDDSSTGTDDFGDGGGMDSSSSFSSGGGGFGGGGGSFDFGSDGDSSMSDDDSDDSSGENDEESFQPPKEPTLPLDPVQGVVDDVLVAYEVSRDPQVLLNVAKTSIQSYFNSIEDAKDIIQKLSSQESPILKNVADRLKIFLGL